MSTLLAATNASGIPYAFTIGGGGTVFYQSDRPTNDAMNPTASTGPINLPGINATSIAAYTGADGLPTVVAITGPVSLVYVNHRGPTGNFAEPLAWSGWQRQGNFFATSITAANNATSGPAIFATGADHSVYENQELASATPTTPAVRTGFDRINGIYATSVKAQADGAGFAVFALAGPATYVYESNTLYGGTPGAGGVLRSSPWNPVDGFVATQFDVSQGFGTATTNPGGYRDIVLYAMGADGFLHTDHLVSGSMAGQRSGTGFHPVYSSPATEFDFSVVVTPGAAIVFIHTGAVPIGIPEGGAQVSFVVSVEMTSPTNPDRWSSGVYLNDSLQPTMIVASVDSKGLPILDASKDGFNAGLYVSRVDPSSSLPSGYLFFTFFGDHYDNPIESVISTAGVAGRPVVFVLEGDGSVDVNQDLAASPSGAIDTYSGFARLSGVSATSIAATAESGGIAVFALVGPLGFIFEDQYRPTGDPLQPFAWTGWGQVGNFTASAIAAVTPGGVPNEGPILLAQGANGLIYALASTAPTIPTDPYTFGSPRALPDLLPFTFSARATATGAEIFGLTGRASFAYANLYLPAGSGGASPRQWTGWQALEDEVVLGIAAIAGTGGVPAITGLDGEDFQVIDEYLGSGEQAAWTGFKVIRYDDFLSTAKAASISYGSGLGGSVFVLSNSKIDPLSASEFTPSVLAGGQPSGEIFSSPVTVDSVSVVYPIIFIPTSFALAPDFSLPIIYAAPGDGKNLREQGHPDGKGRRSLSMDAVRPARASPDRMRTVLGPPAASDQIRRLTQFQGH